MSDKSNIEKEELHLISELTSYDQIEEMIVNYSKNIIDGSRLTEQQLNRLEIFLQKRRGARWM